METFILIVMLFYPSGKYEHENRPVTVPVCQVVNGVRVEDSTCGIKACLKMGHEREAEIWGIIPGMTFGTICQKVDGSETVKECPGASGGHPALHPGPCNKDTT